MTGELIAPEVRDHLDSLVPPRPAEMVAMEEDARRRKFPIIGPTCGHLCYQIARMTRATRIFEMGSGFGYSTAWFARAVVENGGGAVHHVVWDHELSVEARGHLDALGLGDVVRYHVAEAVETLGAQRGPFDIIFCDIEKEDYPGALPVITERLRTGGILIVDNLLWHGRIFDPEDRSAATQAVREMTEALAHDSGWVSTLVPIRDGLGIAWRGEGGRWPTAHD